MQNITLAENSYIEFTQPKKSENLLFVVFTCSADVKLYIYYTPLRCRHTNYITNYILDLISCPEHSVILARTEYQNPQYLFPNMYLFKIVAILITTLGTLRNVITRC